MTLAEAHREIAAQRLRNQRLEEARERHAAAVVAWLGAVQAQEYAAAKWALGLRMPAGTTDADIERAFADGSILRTHVMRPTWHFVHPDDIRWMQELTAPRVLQVMASRHRELELDARTVARGIAVIERALAGGVHLTRTELGDRLADAGLVARGPRLAHLLMCAELEAIVCSGPRRGKQFTYALVAERAPRARGLPRDEAMARLAGRYFGSHGPATPRDFAWWSGLTVADARRGLEMVGAKPEAVDGHTYWALPSVSRSGACRRKADARGPVAHLLPIYDEYLVAYRDRVAVPHRAPGAAPPRAGFDAFQHAVIVAGQVAGTWAAERKRGGVAVDVRAECRLGAAERRAVSEAVERYRRFLHGQNAKR